MRWATAFVPVLGAALLSAAAALADPPTPATPRPAPPRRGAEVIGRVTRGGRPVAASVEVRRLFALDDDLAGSACLPVYERLLAGPDATASVAATTADKDGRYVADGLEPGVYEIVAVDPEGARGAGTCTVPVAGIRVSVDLAMPAQTFMVHCVPDRKSCLRNVRNELRNRLRTAGVAESGGPSAASFPAPFPRGAQRRGRGRSAPVCPRPPVAGRGRWPCPPGAAPASAPGSASRCRLVTPVRASSEHSGFQRMV